MADTDSKITWNFQRMGGNDQVILTSMAELRHLRELDPKLWGAMSCPAKGLEFDSVIVFNATEGAYPYFYNLRNNDQYHIREDARRFYVAISRARKHLCFTYSAVGGNGSPVRPTPFLQSIAHKLAHFGFNPETGKTESLDAAQ